MVEIRDNAGKPLYNYNHNSTYTYLDGTLTLNDPKVRETPERDTSTTIDYSNKLDCYSFGIGVSVAFLLIAIAAMIYPPCK